MGSKPAVRVVCPKPVALPRVRFKITLFEGYHGGFRLKEGKAYYRSHKILLPNGFGAYRRFNGSALRGGRKREKTRQNERKE
jgi:hypothetical protein